MLIWFEFIVVISDRILFRTAETFRQLKTALYLSNFNWHFSQYKRFIVIHFFPRNFFFAGSLFRRSLSAGQLTQWDWYTVLFGDMPGSLCFCNWSVVSPPAVHPHPLCPNAFAIRWDCLVFDLRQSNTLCFFQNYTKNKVFFISDEC